jgi:Tfp pilus assembly protein PilN
MIKINLLGKKKVANIPFGLDEKMAKLGVTTDDLTELRPQLIKLAILIAGVYLTNYVPNYLQAEKIKVLDAQIAVNTQKAQVLEKELASKKDLRRQMEDLNKGEVELQRQVNGILGLQKDRGIAFRTIDSLVASMPAKVWMNDFSFNHRQVRVTGGSWEYFPINDFVKTITETSQFKDVIFRGIRADPPKGLIPGIAEQVQRTKSFELEFTVKGADES